MTGYRRFIAYVYEYRKGKKENNCGFIKVEVRNSICTIELHLQVEGLAAKEACRVFCFLRKEGLMNGVLIGTCMTQTDRIECLIETEALNMGNSQTPLGKMGGMVILTESGGFFGTEWDDQAIRPENFKEMKAGEETKTPEAPQPEAPQPEALQPEAPQPEAPQSEESQPGELQLETVQPEASKQELPQMEINPQNISEAVKEKENIKPLEPVTPESGSGNIEAPEETELIRMQSVSTQPEKQSLPFGQPFCPFADNDLSQCWKIHPQDLIHFPRRQCGLRNNRFLQYGYYNFGHILLCRYQNGKYILGVPGSYDQQEQFMAGMFGFSCFKESPHIKAPKGKGGYWYRSIDPPTCC